MQEIPGTMALAAAGMEVQASRLRLVSENLANADTPGYRRKLAGFALDTDTGLLRQGPIRLDPRELPRIHDPGHPMADAQGYYSGSNVDLLIEIADAREAQRSYEANLRLFDQSRQMTQSLFEMLRR